ncbi:MAG: CPBP family intramembrane glutamic endopeptidase [Acidobacteriaceae bacterium]
MSIFRGPGRGRAMLRFVFAAAYFIVALRLADSAAQWYSFGVAYPLVRNLLQLFLEVIGFGYMGLAFDGARQPLRAMGLARRPGWLREFALGAAIGWGMITAIVLILALSGALYVHFWWTPRAFVLLAIQLGVLAVGALADEVAFRGYPFQRLLEVLGPFSATVMAGVFFALLRMESPEAGTAGIWGSGIAAVLLSVAYLRTRALWLPWGLHFAWLASMGALFGLPLAGSTQAATVVQTETYGPLWMTGGDYGPEASWLAVGVLLAGLYVLVRATRDLSWQYNQPELRPAGIAVEIHHSAPAPQSVQAEQPGPQLVQIATLASARPAAAGAGSPSAPQSPGPSAETKSSDGGPVSS